MKLEKEAKLIKVKSENNINGDNYTEIRLDGALPHKDFKNIVNNFAGKKIKLTLEVEEPILDEEERKYLSGVIRPFRDRIECIVKADYNQKYEFIIIRTKHEADIIFPNFETATMYKNMELNKEYTLEELGL